MEKRIIRMSAYAREVIDHEKNGYVHSVYGKTVNLCFGCQLIALQCNGTPLSPLSIIIQTDDEFTNGKIQVGDRAVRKLQEILISGIRYYEENTEHVNLKLNSLGRGNAREFYFSTKALLYDGLMDLLKEKKSLDLFFYKGKAVCMTLVSLYAEKIIQKFKEALWKEDYNRAAGEIIQLVGLGKGLTPSGDDFLCGVMAGLTCCSGEQKAANLLDSIKRYVSTAVKETNDISGAFLKCAVDGYYSEAIIKLPMQDKAIQIAGLFSPIGHSSGADTLCGIYFIVESLPLIVDCRFT